MRTLASSSSFFRARIASLRRFNSSFWKYLKRWKNYVERVELRFECSGASTVGIWNPTIQKLETWKTGHFCEVKAFENRTYWLPFCSKPFENRTIQSGSRMQFKNRTIWCPIYFRPFKNRTRPVFGSQLNWQIRVSVYVRYFNISVSLWIQAPTIISYLLKHTTILCE